MTNNKCNRLVILSKFPSQGKVKTRLADTIGEIWATQLAKSMLVDLCRHHLNRSYSVCIYAPEVDTIYCSEYRALVPSEIDIFFFGGSMLRGKESVLDIIFDLELSKFDKVIAIMADTPGIDSSLIYNAFSIITRTNVVIGPDSGAGYYLVGLAQYVDLFTEFPEKRSPYYDKTLALIKDKGLHYSCLKSLPDIDLIGDIKKVDWECAAAEWLETKRTINDFADSHEMRI